ncbi:hypothetical protein H8A97_02940 [Bradyrhizobium sp. Arg62]|uniref:hypothetical protein n=1 Tax=Bradyrhizobium TaxID=374 RepID=UPI001E5621F8|nr:MULTISPECIES: hypothetical protein [Bradyrhizobium]MCC8944086.1 hypothetical protein [Bradyrhizobium brasilense]MCP1849426.1 hypothetical protein [Bradyrhizobium sp. USDA 4541]
MLVYRPTNLQIELERLRRSADDLLARANAALGLPKPDTFLGRSHHEPIPLPNERDFGIE